MMAPIFINYSFVNPVCGQEKVKTNFKSLKQLLISYCYQQINPFPSILFYVNLEQKYQVAKMVIK